MKNLALGAYLFLKVGCAGDDLEVDLGGTGNLVTHGVAAVKCREVCIRRGHSGADIPLPLQRRPHAQATCRASRIFPRVDESVPGNEVVQGHTNVQDIRVTEELPATIPHIRHEVLDKAGEAVLFRLASLDLCPNARDLRVSGYSTDVA